VVFGERWRESAGLFGWLSVAYVSQAAFWLGQSLSFTSGRSDRVIQLSTIQLGLSGALALVLSPFGMGGVAAGFALGAAVGCVAMQLAVKRQLGLSWVVLARTALPAVMGTLATGLALWNLPHTGLDAWRWLGLMMALGLGIACYAAIATLVHWLMRRHAAP